MRSEVSAAELRAALDPITPVFVLVDPMLGEPLPVEWIATDEESLLQQHRQALWMRDTARIPLNPRAPIAPHLHPYVVELHGLQDPLLETTLTLAQGEFEEAIANGLSGTGRAAYRIGGWLQSHLRAPELAELLAPVMRVNTEAFTRKTYLRLADCRVLALLRDVVGDRRLQQQFGDLQRWVYLDTKGTLNHLRADPSATPAALRLTYDEWAVMEQGEHIAVAIAMALGEQGPSSETLRAQPDQLLREAARNASVQARQAAIRWPHRFQQARDNITWAALSLLHPQLPYSDAVGLLMQDRGTAGEPAEPMHLIHPEIAALLRDGHPGTAHER